MNEHHEELNGHTPARSIRHTEIEDQFAAYTASELAPGERDAVARHLAGCAACRAALAETQRIRALLRTLSVVAAPAPEASLAGAVLARLASSGDTTTGLIGEWEDGVEDAREVAHETDPERTPAAWGRQDAPALLARHARRPATIRRGALVPALAATAALILVSVLVYGSFGAGLRPKPPAAHPTPRPAGPILPVYGGINDISMLSPSDGWAVGSVAQGPATRNVPAPLTSLIMHYTGGQWQPVSDTFPDVYLQSVSMYGPDDGWAVGRTMHAPLRGVVLRYSGGHWREVPVPSTLVPTPLPFMSAPEPHADFQPTQVQAVGPDDAWIVDNASIVLVHYREGVWSVVQSPQVLTISMVSDSEGWAIDYSSVIYHFHAGRWTMYLGLSAYTAVTAIHMISASDGWALATYTVYDRLGNPHGPSTHWLLRYHNGAWTKTTLPTQFYGAYSASLGGFAIAPSGDVWIDGTITDQEPGLGTPFLLRYQGGQFQPVNLPIRLDAIVYITLASPDEGWALGDQGGTEVLLHLHNGVWSVTGQNWGDIQESEPVNRSQATGWQRYTDPTYGFSLEVPASYATAGATLVAQYQDQNPFMSLIFRGPYPSSDQLWVMVYTNPDVDVGPAVCQNVGNGTPITVGRGIAAHQVDRTSAGPAPGIPGGVPAVEARFLTGGEYVDIQLMGQGSASTFLARYGATWQHVLASFNPGATHPNAHACGS
ncbi:MAG TPA: zf-HC2 domain-containing protein [Ktedonobacterales bacterium]